MYQYQLVTEMWTTQHLVVNMSPMAINGQEIIRFLNIIIIMVYLPIIILGTV
jgi:hypothetical protein